MWKKWGDIVWKWTFVETESNKYQKSKEEVKLSFLMTAVNMTKNLIIAYITIWELNKWGNG